MTIYKNAHLLTSIHYPNITEAKWNNFSKQKVTSISSSVHYIKLHTPTKNKCHITLLLNHIVERWDGINIRGRSQTFVITPIVRVPVKN